MGIEYLICDNCHCTFYEGCDYSLCEHNHKTCTCCLPDAPRMEENEYGEAFIKKEDCPVCKKGGSEGERLKRALSEIEYARVEIERLKALLCLERGDVR